MNIDLKKIRSWLAGERLKVLVRLFFTVLAAWLMATIFASLSTHFLMGKGFFSGRASGRGKNSAQVDTAKKLNYRDVRKAVLKRNIFNATGEVPDQKELADNTAQEQALAGKCNKPTLKLKVVGTIYLGGDNSIVSVREASYSQADTYRVGDELIGYEGVRIVAIEREQVVIDNGGSRECYKIKKPANIASRTAGYQPRKRPAQAQTSDGGSRGGAVVLDSAWVEAQLGPGFSQVLKSARLIPNKTDDEGINGFKIFAIRKGTLFNKIGLRNGDIIQKVNDTSLEQAEQGFALYQTFQEDQEIVFNIMRKNKPQTISVVIK